MNSDYKKLFEVQDDLINHLKKTVDSQTKLIIILEIETKALMQENQELKEEIQSLAQICEEHRDG